MDVVVLGGEQRGLIWCCDMQWCPAFGSTGEQWTFFDWYESWLDDSLARVQLA